MLTAATAAHTKHEPYNIPEVSKNRQARSGGQSRQEKKVPSSQ
jgi:hypothetical protein